MMALGSKRVSVRSIGGTHSVRYYGPSREDAERTLGRLFCGLILHNATDPDFPDFAAAMGWRAAPGSDQRTEIGNLEYRAKWLGDEAAIEQLISKLVKFVVGHPILSRSATVVAMPSSKSLVSRLATAVAAALGADVVVGAKTDPGRVQHGEREGKDFVSSYEAARGTIQLPSAPVISPALIVDDLFQSGGSISEVTRCLRRQGVRQVYSVTAVKTPWMCRQT